VIGRSTLSLQSPSRQRAAVLRARQAVLAGQDDADLVPRAGLSLASDVRRRARFLPSHVSNGWYRLQASAQSAGEWTSWKDVSSSASVTFDPARQPAVEASSNGLPLANFAGTDQGVLALTAATSSTSRMGIWLRIKPTSIATANQYVIACSVNTGATDSRFLVQVLATGILRLVLYQSTFVQRIFESAAGVISTAALQSVGFSYDKDGATEADKVKIFVGGSFIAATPSGAGVLGAIAAATGNMIIGDGRVVALSPFTGRYGPNLLTLGRHLTTGELQQLESYDFPT
jgi:hypothetical protein